MREIVACQNIFRYVYASGNVCMVASIRWLARRMARSNRFAVDKLHKLGILGMVVCEI
jgi:hypothetical protein